MITRVARIASRVGLLLAALFALLLWLGVVVTTWLDHTWPLRDEAGAPRSLAAHRSGGLDDLTQVVSWAGAAPVVLGASLVVAVVLRSRLGRWREPVFLLLAVAGGVGISALTALVIARPRPPVHHLDADTISSYPSGGTAAATALAVAVAALVGWHVDRAGFRRVLAGLLALAPLAVGFAAVYRGAAYPSDVAAGVLVGLGSVTAAGLAVLNRRWWGERLDTEGHHGTSGENGRRAAIVYNPLKVADFPAMQERVDTFMSRAGWEQPLWLETTADDPGVGMCERAMRDECDVVFVCGGDGTVMACVTALAGHDLPMALLPSGTGNLLARNLGLPLDDEAAALRIGISDSERRIDVAAVEERKFAVMAGIGFDAAMMRDAPEGMKRVVGWPAYVVSGAKHLRGRGIRVRVTLDDGAPFDRRVRTAVVGNVGKLQAGIPLLPDAEPDDGVLDVVLIAPGSMVGWLRVASRVLTRRRGEPDRRVERFRAERVRLETSTVQPRQLDGDIIEDGTVMDIQIEPGALAVRVPPRKRG